MKATDRMKPQFIFTIFICSCISVKAQKNCQTPKFQNGFALPEAVTYQDGAEVTYACIAGYKPVSQVWWGHIICTDGEWSPAPMCIDKKACLAPEVAHGQVRKSASKEWYDHETSVPIECDKGYKLSEKARPRLAKCTNGEWTVPACDRMEYVCGAPPEVEHATITQKAQSVFEDGDRVNYTCNKGYQLSKGDRSVDDETYCSSGTWKNVPKCSPRQQNQDARLASRAPRHQNQDTGLFSRAEDCGKPPEVSNSVYTVRGQSVTYECSHLYKLEGSVTIRCFGGEWMDPPVCKPPRHQNQDTGLFSRAEDCGKPPEVSNSVYTVRGQSVTYECSHLYKLEGSATIRCFGGEWMDPPICKRDPMHGP
ncbi:coagulation factor XIII B chain isoform X3 [Chanos chanos]|uniref:Coagulation factor XIII B chain isoform X3 n=1 Tax=Chanos chanos TaxID=29144 RepID=A0A6J2VB92_CHACN|nr:coagulation factor XIII B chain-like isoform X3 [Chanos chanos]